MAFGLFDLLVYKVMGQSSRSQEENDAETGQCDLELRALEVSSSFSFVRVYARAL